MRKHHPYNLSFVKIMLTPDRATFQPFKNKCKQFFFYNM